jgi:hypothetical protein
MIFLVLRLGINTSNLFGDKAVLNLLCDQIKLLYFIPWLMSKALRTSFIFYWLKPTNDKSFYVESQV